MRIVIGTDEDRGVLDHLVKHLRSLGHEVTRLPAVAWGKAAQDAARSVTTGAADVAIVCCWTGTGVSIAANKVPGVRCALCVDAPTAAGARKWNDANVLALSLRLLSEPLATEIVDAFLTHSYEGTEGESLALLT